MADPSIRQVWLAYYHLRLRMEEATLLPVNPGEDFTSMHLESIDEIVRTSNLFLRVHRPQTNPMDLGTKQVSLQSHAAALDTKWASLSETTTSAEEKIVLAEELKGHRESIVECCQDIEEFAPFLPVTRSHLRIGRAAQEASESLAAALALDTEDMAVVVQSPMKALYQSVLQALAPFDVSHPDEAGDSEPDDLNKRLQSLAFDATDFESGQTGIDNLKRRIAAAFELLSELRYLYRLL